MSVELRRRLGELGSVLAAHAGGIELVELNGGVARVRYTGMCTGCPLRPVTTASTVRPALLAVDGVDELEVEGSRISAEAEARIAAAFRQGTDPVRGLSLKSARQ